MAGWVVRPRAIGTFALPHFPLAFLWALVVPAMVYYFYHLPGSPVNPLLLLSPQPQAGSSCIMHVLHWAVVDILECRFDMEDKLDKRVKHARSSYKSLYKLLCPVHETDPLSHP